MSSELQQNLEMLNPTAEAEAPAPEADGNPKKRSFWSTVVGYVGVTAGIYTLTVAVHVSGIMLVFYWPEGIVGALLASTVGAFYISLPVMLTALMVGILCVAVAQVVLLSLSIDYERLYIGGAVGGLIAFVCSLLLFGAAILSSPDDSSLAVQHLIAFYFTLLATVMGQIAGVKGASEARFSEGHQPSNYSMPSVPKFQIRHLLWITLWCAVLLTILRGLGLLASQLGIFTLAWLIAQYFTLKKVLQVLERKAAFRLAAQERST